MGLRLEGPGELYVEVIADSVSAHTGDRVTSFEVNMHRFILAEVNTHCVFSRNSASSRAIPVGKQLDRYLNHTALPYSWPAEQKGMQGGAELEGQDLEDAQNLFRNLNKHTWGEVMKYLEDHPDRRLHKSVLNRLLEPMQYHKALITSSLWENFLKQRAHPDAQPEFRVLAELIKELLEKSEPKELHRGQWHLPYIREDEKTQESVWVNGFDARHISSARCGRTSYMTQSGVRDYIEDVNLYDGLVTKNHWSPLEHPCTPDPRNVTFESIYDPDTGDFLTNLRTSKIGKFSGWQQWRHVVEARQGYVSQA